MNFAQIKSFMMDVFFPKQKVNKIIHCIVLAYLVISFVFLGNTLSSVMFTAVLYLVICSLCVYFERKNY